MKKILLFLVITFGISSCSGFLDLRPNDMIIPQSAEDYSTLLHTMLNDIEYGNFPYILDNFDQIVDNEACVDDLDANIYLGATSLNIYLGTFMSSRRVAYYKSVYERIMNCNMILDGLSGDDSELARKVKAAAYAIRGICHYNILRQFCEPVTDGVYPDLGVVCVDHFDIEAKLPRSSYEVSVKFIEDDFINSLAYNMTDKTYMFTADVVDACMARLYFWTQQWDNALEKAESVLAKYPLVEGDAYKEMFTSRLSKGEVIIKSRVYTNTSIEWSEGTSMTQLQKRPVNKTLIDLFDQPDKDIRYGMMMNAKREVLKRPFASIRSAEMALIVAECYYHKGEESNALRAINDLRRHRISDYMDLQMNDLPAVSNANIIKVDARSNTLTPLISLILNERRKELFMEGDRLFERKRNGRPETWVAHSGFCYVNEKFMYTFPLPYADIKLVPGLVQNPGYDVIQEK